jgi:hypothetical protein
MPNVFEDEYSISDYDSNEYDIVYESDEPSLTRFNIVLCELYNDNIHGPPLSNSDVAYHFIIISRYKKLEIDFIEDTADYINSEYIYLHNQRHKIFKNYINIITQPNYVKPEIAECMNLPTGEIVAILKTFWIKLIQRTWKRIYKERKNVFKRRSSIHALKYREITGKWPESCRSPPSIRGMLLA